MWIMLQRKYRSISIWTGVFVLALALLAGMALSTSGVFAGAPAGQLAANPPAQGQAKQSAPGSGVAGNAANGSQAQLGSKTGAPAQSKSDPKQAKTLKTSGPAGKVVI